MRKRGEGTVELVGQRWRFRCPDGFGGRYDSPAEYDDEAAAERGLLAYREARHRGELVPVRGLTLRAYVEDTWLPRMERELPRSVKTYRSQWRSQISQAPFAGYALRSIRRRDIRQWSALLEVTPQSPVSVLRTILAAALDDELLDVNPAAKLRLTRKRRKSTSPTPAEARALLACSEIPWHVRAVVAVNLGTALRPGEWRHLRLVDVHLDADPPRLLVVRGSDLEDETKTNTHRVVPLFGLALEVLRQWLDDLPAYAPINPRGLVFPRANGRLRRQTHPFGTHAKESLWHIYLRRAGVRPCVRLHDLRHAAATSLLTGAHGRAWSPVEVQHLLGHASVQTTESTYLHPGETLVVRAARETALQDSGSDRESLRIRSHPSTSQLSPSSTTSPATGAETVPQATFAALWTDVGLDGELREAISRLHAGRLSQAEAASLGARIVRARRGADPVELAAARLEGEHWRAALSQLVDLLVPDATTARRRGVRGAP